MSHIAEVYAKDLGVKIGKPKITDHFYPNIKGNYICFDFEGKNPSEQYKYWDIVQSLISRILDSQGISLLQIPNVSNKQKNFFIKKSLLYLGISNQNVNIADTYGVPSVSVLSTVYENNFNFFDRAIVLTPDFTEIKPSFNPNCQRLNEIKPEQIAQAVLDQLKIQETIKFKTIKIGEYFTNQIVEIVPNFSAVSEELRGKPINIRGDLHWDLENVVRWCQFSFVNLYLNSPFNIEFLQHMPNLKQVTYKYKKQEDLTEFFKALKKRKINIIIQPSEDFNISDVRFEYFDYNVLPEPKAQEEVKASKFISKKRFVTNAEVFNSESSAKRLDKSNNFVYDEASSKELESLYLYDEE